jgi:cytochrome P450
MPQTLSTAGETVEDPFAGGIRGLDDQRQVRDALRAAGPVVVADAPAGGPVWIVTDHDLARSLLVDPRVAKDPALAPPGWDGPTAGLKPAGSAQPSLTTLDGPAHTALRRAHAPLLSAQRMAAFGPRVGRIAEELLHEASGQPVVDLMADFTTRYPLTVVCDLLGIPFEQVDQAVDACRGMHSSDPAEVGKAMATFAALAHAALENDHGLAAELRDRLPAGTTPDQLDYFLFTLVFAGQLTTDPAAGFVLARLLDGERARTGATSEEFVRDVLRRHPPARFTLWRFTTAEMCLAEIVVPAGSPVLVDIEGINASAARDLTFGAGPHYCTGAHLAQLELEVLVDVAHSAFPVARLDVPFSALRQIRSRGIGGGRLTELPVRLTPASGDVRSGGPGGS